MTRVKHHDQPYCVECGNRRGPWVPTGDHDRRGVQTFRCAPGRGCADSDTVTDRAQEADEKADRALAALRAAVAADPRPREDIAAAVGMEAKVLDSILSGRRRAVVRDVTLIALEVGTPVGKLFNAAPDWVEIRCAACNTVIYRCNPPLPPIQGRCRDCHRSAAVAQVTK